MVPQDRWGSEGMYWREGCDEGYRNVRGFLGLQLRSTRLMCKSYLRMRKELPTGAEELSLRLTQSRNTVKPHQPEWTLLQHQGEYSEGY